MGDGIEHQREGYERYFLAELRKRLDLDRVVEVWSKETGYSEVKKGKMWTWEGLEVEEVYLLHLRARARSRRPAA